MGLSNPSYFITTKNKKNMENPIIVPFDLNTARKIKSGEIEGSVLINNIEIEFVYESKDCAGPYNLLFVRKDGYGISAIYANTEGCTLGDTTLELEVEAGAYFKKGDVLISTLGNPFIYNGIINRKGDMGCIYGISAYGEITSEEVPIWTRWVDEERQEIDAKGLDCLGYVRELRVDDYLSPTTLEEIAEEIKKKVNRG